MRSIRVVLIGLVLVLLTAAVADAQERRRGRGRPEGAGAREGGGQSEDRSDGVKPYGEVITKEAKTDVGVFDVHRIGEKLFYEIPAAQFDREFLWVTQIEGTQSGDGFAGTGVGNRVVRWQLRDEQILLRDVKYAIRAEEGSTIHNAVSATSIEPIIQSFDVKTWGKDKAAVIEVTDLFKSDTREFGPARRLNASGLDKGRTFIEESKSFAENIETKVLATYDQPRVHLDAPREEGVLGA